MLSRSSSPSLLQVSPKPSRGGGTSVDKLGVASPDRTAMPHYAADSKTRSVMASGPSKNQQMPKAAELKNSDWKEPQNMPHTEKAILHKIKDFPRYARRTQNNFHHPQCDLQFGAVTTSSSRCPAYKRALFAAIQ